MVLALVQVILIAITAIYEYKKGSIGVFLWAMLLLNFAVPHLLTIVTGMEIYSSATYEKASLFAILTTGLYLLTKIIVDRSKHGDCDCFTGLRANLQIVETISAEGMQYERRLARNALFLLLLFFTVFMVDTINTQGSLFNTSWGQYYKNASSLYDVEFSASFFSIWMKYVCFAVGGLSYSCFKRKRIGIAVAVTALICFVLLLTRNRILVLPLIVCVIIFFAVKYRRLSIKLAILMLIAACVAIYVVYALRTFRHAGNLNAFLSMYSSFSDFHAAVMDDILYSDGELWLRNIFYYFIEKDNAFPSFGEGHTYLRLLMILVPTRLAGGLKPTDFAITMASAWTGNYNNTTHSVHPTFFGDCFANFHWFGAFLGIFWAVFIRFLNGFLNKRNKMVRECLICLYGVMLIIIGRGSVYNACVIGLYGTIIVFAIEVISRITVSRELKLVIHRRIIENKTDTDT